MIRRPPRSTQSRSSAASDVYKRQIVHSSALLGALSELFENLWTRALPVSSWQDGLPTAGPEQPTPNQRLIALLLAGLTDTASARPLGVSQRTVQRRVAALLGELGVQTRFQAGAKLAFRDTEQPRRMTCLLY